MKSRWSLVIVLAAIACPATAQDKKPLLRWGTDTTGGAPYVYQNSAGEYVGFEVELAAYLAEKTGRTAAMKDADWDTLPELLNKIGDADLAIDVVLNGYELRNDLAKDYAVTVPYYAYRLVLVARRDNELLSNWSDLATVGTHQKTVGVLGGSAAQADAKAVYGSRIDLVSSKDVANIFGRVADGQLDGTIQDNPAAVYFLKQNASLKAVGTPRQMGYYVMYLRKDDQQLTDALNSAIRAGFQDGTLQKIYRKYGLWNNDQRWLGYSQTGSLSEIDEGDSEGDVSNPKVNPWPRMLRELVEAAGTTIFLSLTSFPLAMVLGLLVGLGRVYGPRWLSIPLGIYVEVLRGTPLMLQLYTIFYLLPKLGFGLDFTPFQAGIIGLAINYSAYEAENYRAGLLAIPRGQMEAALALGMTPMRALRIVVVPQAMRIVIPPVTNDFIALFKDTSVCSVILITELTHKYNELYNFNRDYVVELAFVTAGLYLAMSYPLAILARFLEKRLGNSAGGGAR